MKSVLVVIIFSLFPLSISYSQTNPFTNLQTQSNPGNYKINAISDEDYSFSISLKGCAYILKPGVSFSTLGAAVDLEYKTSKKIGIINSNSILFNNSDYSKSNYSLLITVGPKFYFSKSDFIGYASILGGGLFGDKSKGFLFIIAPALGIDYEIEKVAKLNLEAKFNVGATIFGISLYPCVNAVITYLIQ